MKKYRKNRSQQRQLQQIILIYSILSNLHLKQLQIAISVRVKVSLNQQKKRVEWRTKTCLWYSVVKTWITNPAYLKFISLIIWIHLPTSRSTQHPYARTTPNSMIWSRRRRRNRRNTSARRRRRKKRRRHGTKCWWRSSSRKNNRKKMKLKGWGESSETEKKRKSISGINLKEG